MNKYSIDEIKEANRIMGERNELRYLPIITDMFGTVVSRFNKDVIDFYGDNVLVELKSRVCHSEFYPETFFGYNKIIRAREEIKRNPNYKVYFAFAFIDGLYLWEYNSNTYEQNGGDTQKRFGGKGKDQKDHYYIHIKNLKKINDRSAWIHPMFEQKAKNKTPKKSGVCLLKPIKQKQEEI